MRPMIILAAGQGSRLRPLTDECPKCMVELEGRPLLYWQTTAALEAGIEDIVIVGGYRVDKLNAPAGKIVQNPEYATTNMVASLWKAKDHFGSGFMVSYADIVYGPETVEKLSASTADIAVVVDRNWKSYWQMRTDDILSDAESLKLGKNGNITSIGQKETSVDNIQGQYIGLLSFQHKGVEKLVEMVEKEIDAASRGEKIICRQRDFNALYMTDLLQGMINAGCTVEPVWTDGGWLEIDSVSDLEVARQLTQTKHGKLVIER